MNIFNIKELPLNTDTLYVSDKGKVFSGGYVAVLEYFTYANEWSDRKHIKRFRKLDTMHKYLDKHYPEFNEEVFQS